MTRTRRFGRNHRYVLVMKCILAALTRPYSRPTCLRRLLGRTIKKLMRGTHRPYRVTKVQSHTVFINEDGMLDRILLILVTPVHK